jgi:predicted protein tyrosine phosphatase
MSSIIVCSLARLEDVIAQDRPSHVLTLLDPEWMIEEIATLGPERHLRLSVHDVASPLPGYIHPDEATVAALLAFGRGWDAAAPLAVHCFAGVSRSSAAAFAIACERNPNAAELDIARSLRRLGPHALPNRGITALADAMLGRKGRMIAAVEAMGGNDFAPTGPPIRLPARFFP